MGVDARAYAILTLAYAYRVGGSSGYPVIFFSFTDLSGTTKNLSGKETKCVTGTRTKEKRKTCNLSK